jgi:hypothetical protein
MRFGRVLGVIAAVFVALVIFFYIVFMRDGMPPPHG